MSSSVLRCLRRCRGGLGLDVFVGAVGVDFFGDLGAAEVFVGGARVPIDGDAPVALGGAVVGAWLIGRVVVPGSAAVSSFASPAPETSHQISRVTRRTTAISMSLRAQYTRGGKGPDGRMTVLMTSR